MKCHHRNSARFNTSVWHRLWCRECREAQHIDALIGIGLTEMRDQSTIRSGMAETLALLDLPAGGRSVRRAAGKVGIVRTLRGARTFAALVLVPLLWWGYINYLPPVQIPPQIAPNPNASTYFREAGDKLVYESEITAALNKPDKEATSNPPKEWLEKRRQAFDQTTYYVPRIFENEHRYSVADMQLLVDRNRAALDTLHAGLNLPYQDIYKRSVSTLFPYYEKYRMLARLLLIKSKVERAHGDWNAAAQTDMDAMEIGTKIPHGATIIGYLSGFTAFAIGSRELWRDIEHLDASQTRAALARLNLMEAERVQWADVLREEKWMMLSSLRDMMRNPDWRFKPTYPLGMTYSDPSMQPFQSTMIAFWLCCWPDSVIQNNMIRYMDIGIEQAKLPYASMKTLPVPPINRDPVSFFFSPLFGMSRFEATRQETQLTLMRTTLALRAYAFDHKGRYPASLAALTPGYLSVPPHDPFANPGNEGQTLLRYRCFQGSTDPTGSAQHLKTWRNFLPGYQWFDSYLLYSVGPDGNDDNGTPVMRHLSEGEKPTGSPNEMAARILVFDPSDKGDIVAGVNR